MKLVAEEVKGRTRKKSCVLRWIKNSPRKLEDWNVCVCVCVFIFTKSEGISYKTMKKKLHQSLDMLLKQYKQYSSTTLSLTNIW